MTFCAIFTLFQATFYAVFTLFQATFRCKGTKKNVYMQEKFTFIEKKSQYIDRDYNFFTTTIGRSPRGS